MRLLLVLFVSYLIPISAASANYRVADADFDSQSLRERESIQEELTWSGDYNGIIDGEFGPRTYEAIVMFQRRKGFAVTGLLSETQRKTLQDNVSMILAEIGYETVNDERANMNLAVPKRLAPNSKPTRRGTRWSSTNDDFVLDSMFIPAGEMSFEQLYRRLGAESGQRRVRYSVIRDDFFVVTGSLSGKSFYTRLYRIPGGTRGITVSWMPDVLIGMNGVILGLANTLFDITEPPMSPKEAPSTATDEFWVMVGSFRNRQAAVVLAAKLANLDDDSEIVQVAVFLTESGLFAVGIGPLTRELAEQGVEVLSGSVAGDPWISSGHGFVSKVWDSESDSVHRVAPLPPGSGSQPSIRTATGTGFFITPDGIMLTNAHVVAECRAIEIPGHGVARILRKDDESDLAIIRVASTEATPHATFQSKRTRVQSEVVVLGYPLSELLGRALNTTSGQVSSLSGIGGDNRFIQVTAPIQPGNSGGPVLDMNGRVVGVATARISDIDVFKGFGALPQNINFAIRKEIVTAFLSAANVDYQIDGLDDKLNGIEVAELGAEFTRSIICMQ